MLSFPFKELMEFGFGVLKLSSKDFWNMTPREIIAAYRAIYPNPGAPIERKRFEELLEQFPDEVNNG